MNPATSNTWFPLFEFLEWSYQSMLVLPTDVETSGPPGSPVTARKWAIGSLTLGQAFESQEGYTVSGALAFAPGVELTVSGQGSMGVDGSPATFKATGTGVYGKTKGAIYELVGWVFAENPLLAGAGKVQQIRGSVRAVRGPDTRPDLELGGMPLGTVGLFEIVRASR